MPGAGVQAGVLDARGRQRKIVSWQVAVALAHVTVLLVQHGVVDVLELLRFVCLGIAARVRLSGDTCEFFGRKLPQESVVPVLSASFAGS